MRRIERSRWANIGVCVFLAVGTARLPMVKAAEDPLVVETRAGLVRGLAREAGGARFLGIPFAQAPVGELRWHEPLPAKDWSGVRDATAYSVPCVQPDLGEWNRNDAKNGQEDCLYLNVITPAWPKKGLLPVMFWIHGGANEGGSGMSDLYTAGTLADHGVVVVTVNYRLGVFGFLTHAELTGESAHHVSGNYGLLDQILALRWVIANIERFGGDAQNITVFGQSAGALDAQILMASTATGLFEKAIEESAPIGLMLAPLSEAEAAGERFALSMGAPKGVRRIAYLRGIPARELIKKLTAHEPHQQFGPVIDGWLLTKSPAEVFAAGQESAIPLLFGTNTRELGDNKTPDQLREMITISAGEHAPEALKAYGLATGGAGASDPMYGSAADQFMADMIFRCPATAEARSHTAANNTTFQYEFNHPVPGQPDAIHSTELSFVFGFYPKEGNLAGPYTAADRKFAGMVESYFTNFAKAGNPNGTGLPVWPEFGSEAAYVKFTRAGTVEEGHHLRGRFCRVYR